LFTAFLVNKLIGRWVFVVRLGVHLSLHSLGWVEWTLPCADDNKPLVLFCRVARIKQPISPARFLLFRTWSTDCKGCRFLLLGLSVMIPEKIVFYLGQRIRTILRNLIEARRRFPRYRKSGHLFPQSSFRD
jgi:hypothetical protein